MHQFPCYLWIPGMLNDVFVAGVPALISVHQRRPNVLKTTSVGLRLPLPYITSVGASCFSNPFQ